MTQRSSGWRHGWKSLGLAQANWADPGEPLLVAEPIVIGMGPEIDDERCRLLSRSEGRQAAAKSFSR